MYNNKLFKHFLAICECVSVGVTIERASAFSINVDIDLNALVLYFDEIFDAFLDVTGGHGHFLWDDFVLVHL